MRDFLYLDIDRVRSFVAQSREGVPETIEETLSKKGSGGVKLGLTADYALEKGSSETRSIHHYLYSILEDGLEESKRFVRVGDGYPLAKWTKNDLPDGAFVLVAGTLWLLDIEGMADALQRMPRIMEISARFKRDWLKKQAQSGAMSQAEFQRQNSELAQTGQGIKDALPIAEMLQKLYGNTIRFRVFPFETSRDHCFTGTMLVDHLQRERANLYAAGSAFPMSRWLVLGIVDHVEPPSAEELTAVAQGDSLEDKMLGLLAAFAGFGKLTVPVAWPALGLTPLAVYRLV
jgi:hypothetical protein